MKHLTSIFLVSFAVLGCSTTGEPGYTCDTSRGCKEIQGPAFDIGRGAKLTPPSGWKFYSYPSAPDPIMEGLREIRAAKGGMVIAITPIPNIDHRVFTDSQLCDMVKQGGSQYIFRSKEKAVNAVPFSHGETVGCYATFTAANAGEKPFAVLSNRHYATVSPFVISAKGVIFSMDAVSERLPDDDYAKLMEAVRQIE